MVSQGSLPFKFAAELRRSGMTALAGLPLYLDLARAAALSESIERHVSLRRGGQGWTDAQMLSSLILLNIAGGDCVDDLRVLEGDAGFGLVLRRVEWHGKPRRERRNLERRFRKERTRAVPSPSAAFRYLSKFHDSAQEKARISGKAFIPKSNAALSGLAFVNKDLIAFAQANHPQSTATLDMDATLVATAKTEALYCYKHFTAYQPLNTWWAEQGLVVHTEFRDGNVPAGHEQLRVFKEALSLLPAGVEEVRLRSDSAGYQHDLMRYCSSGENERFGKIDFAIAADVSSQLRLEVAKLAESQWKPIFRKNGKDRIRTDQEWADVCFVPNTIGDSKSAPSIRYLAIREPLRQRSLPGMEDEQRELPFPTMDLRGAPYKVFAVATNLDWDGEAVILWHRERCGKSEEVHSVMKTDLAGGQLPSGDFGENAAWWWIVQLAHNLNAIMKKVMPGEGWISKRLKAIRFGIIHLPGRVQERSRQLWIWISKQHPSFDLFFETRRLIAALSPASPG